MKPKVVLIKWILYNSIWNCPSVLLYGETPNALQKTSLRGHRAFPEVVLFDSAIAAVGRVRNRTGLVHSHPLLSECVCLCVCCWVINIPVCVYLSSVYCLFGCIYLLLLLFVCLLLFTVVLYCSAYCLLVLFIVMVVLISKNKKNLQKTNSKS